MIMKVTGLSRTKKLPQGIRAGRSGGFCAVTHDREAFTLCEPGK